MLLTNQIICLISEKGVTKGKIYNTLIPCDNSSEAIIVDDNDERHELVSGEFDGYYGPNHLKSIAIIQMDTDIDENNLTDIIKYTYKL